MKSIHHTLPALTLLALTFARSVAQSNYEPYTFTTLAGRGGYSTNEVGSAARLWLPLTVAVDSAGNVYVAEQSNNSISKVTPTGAATTLAGQPGSSGSANEAGSAARFNVPSCAALDNAGNVYVADTCNHTIRKVNPAGVVTTLAGLAGSSGSANGTASAARFSNPAGLAVDNMGNLYVADFYFNTTRKGVPAPTILDSGFNGGQFGFNLTGPPGRSVVVDVSPDLQNWFPVWTNTFGGGLTFSDAQSGVSSNRFYRSRLP